MKHTCTIVALIALALLMPVTGALAETTVYMLVPADYTPSTEHVAMTIGKPAVNNLNTNSGSINAGTAIDEWGDRITDPVFGNIAVYGIMVVLVDSLTGKHTVVQVFVAGESMRPGNKLTDWQDYTLDPNRICIEYPNGIAQRFRKYQATCK